MNGDPDLDAVFGYGWQSLALNRNQVCLGNGAGGFTCSDVSTDTNHTHGVALGDVNGDSDLDAVFGNYAQRNRACLGNGAGGFTCIDVSTDTNSTYAVALSVCADGSTPPCIATAGVPDSDGDGVPDRLDVCSDTVIPEGVPTKGLGVNRWALVDGDGIFDTTLPPGGGKSPQLAYTIEETAGCSCEQIITALDLGKGHEKFGCSISAMETFLEFVNP